MQKESYLQFCQATHQSLWYSKNYYRQSNYAVDYRATSNSFNFLLYRWLLFQYQTLQNHIALLPT